MMSPINLIRSYKRKQHSNVEEIFVRVSHKSADIPLFNYKVSAGFPSPAGDYVEVRLSADQYLVKNPTATYFVRVKGDSMINAGIFNGDVLVVDRSLDPSIGQIILAEVDGEFTVKYLGQNQLVPANPLYQSMPFDNADTVALIGVVTGSMRKFL
jgi:DNA polymerase V